MLCTIFIQTALFPIHDHSLVGNQILT